MDLPDMPSRQLLSDAKEEITQQPMRQLRFDRDTDFSDFIQKQGFL